MPIVAMNYIEVDDRGVAKLVGTRSKVRQVVMDTMNGMSPADIHEQYPHLSMAQIHATLAYYHSHKNAIDAEITEGARYADEMRAKNSNRWNREEMLARLPAADRERLSRESDDHLDGT